MGMCLAGGDVVCLCAQRTSSRLPSQVDARDLRLRLDDISARLHMPFSRLSDLLQQAVGNAGQQPVKL